MASPTYIKERDAELFLRYYQTQKQEPTLSIEQAIRKAIKSPTSHYHVSLYETYREILNIIHKREPSRHMKPMRRKQIADIYKKYCELASKPTFKGCSVFFIVQFAIAEPAPQFYLSYSRAVNIICEIKRNYDIEEVR